MENNTILINLWVEKLLTNKKNDNYKMQIAKENGIKYYFQINCYHSDLEWVKSNIISSDFLSQDQIDKIDWVECNRYALYSSNVVKACELFNEDVGVGDISKILKHSKPTIRKYLKRGAIIGLCNYAS
nr:MAG TPA: helix-turn-helix domain protein [Caudoviricetes sp.]